MARFSNDVASPHYNGIRLQNNPVDLDQVARDSGYDSFSAWQEADPIQASLAEREHGQQGTYQQAALHDDPDWLKQGLIIGGTVAGGALADWAMAGSIPSIGAGTVGTLPSGVGLPGTLAGAPIAAGTGAAGAGAAGAGAAGAGTAAGAGGAAAGIGTGTVGLPAGVGTTGTLAGAGGGAAAATPTLAGAGVTGTTGTLPAGVGTTGTLGTAPPATGLLGKLTTAQKIGDALETVGAGVGGATKATAANRGAENLFNIDEARQASIDYAANAKAQDDFQNELVARSKLEATARGTEAGNIYRDSVLHNPTAGPQNPRPQVFSPGLIKTYDDLAEQGSTDLAQRPVYDPRTMTAPQYTPYNRPLPVFKQPGTLEQAGNWVGPTLSTVGSILAKRYL